MKNSLKVSNLKRHPDTGTVVAVEYNMEFSLGKEIKTEVGIVYLMEDPRDTKFIPYEDLTEDEVKVWVENELGLDKISEVETRNIQYIILPEIVDEKINPKYLDGMPW